MTENSNLVRDLKRHHGYAIIESYIKGRIHSLTVDIHGLTLKNPERLAYDFVSLRSELRALEELLTFIDSHELS